METFETMRANKVAEARNGKDLFEVFTSEDARFPYAGYFNGKISITATRPDVVLRGLQRKHIIGLPEGKLINFNRRPGDREVHKLSAKKPGVLNGCGVHAVSELSDFGYLVAALIGMGIGVWLEHRIWRRAPFKRDGRG